MSDDTVNSADDMYELDELLGAYALDAVDADERARVEDYLRINPRAAAEVRDHREVASMLAFTGMDAPEGVWSRIADELDGPAPIPGPELASVFAGGSPSKAQRLLPPPAANAQVVPIGSARRRPVGSWLLGAAAGLAIAVAGVVVVTSRSDSGGDPLANAMAAAQADRDSIRTELVSAASDTTALGVIDQDGHGYLDATSLPTLDSGMTYQLWGVLAETGDVVSLGVLGPNPELETFTVEAQVAALAVTIEASPGVISDGNPDGAFVGSF